MGAAGEGAHVDARYLVFYGFPVLRVAHHGQLQLGHLLHLAVDVDLLNEAFGLVLQQPNCVLLAVLLREKGRACRVDGSDPVFQICLAGGLNTQAGKKKKKKTIWNCFTTKRSPKRPVGLECVKPRKRPHFVKTVSFRKHTQPLEFADFLDCGGSVRPSRAESE